jgi:hypothetical protein
VRTIETRVLRRLRRCVAADDVLSAAKPQPTRGEGIIMGGSAAWRGTLREIHTLLVNRVTLMPAPPPYVRSRLLAALIAARRVPGREADPELR